MSEPKKETVRIVLPPRKEGQAATSTPRESAMINLPPKPVSAKPPEAAEAPAGEPAEAAIPAEPRAPSAPMPPSALKPPSPPSGPKPPAAPAPPAGLKPAAPRPPGGAPLAPKPAGPPAAPGGLKPAAAPTSPMPMKPGAPKPTGPAPLAAKPPPKKETAKVTPAPAVMPKPQATVQMQKPSASAARPDFKIQSAPTIVEADASDEPDMTLSVVASVAAVLALLVQLWFLV